MDFRTTWDLEWERKFLKDDLEGMRALYYNGAPIAIELPPTVALQITETMPAVKGNSATTKWQRSDGSAAMSSSSVSML